jgi:hypothetical protein
VAPGFIDIQVNGAYGVDFSDPQLAEPECTTSSDSATEPSNSAIAAGVVGENVASVLNKFLQHGVTSILFTVISSQPQAYHLVLPKLRRQLNFDAFLAQTLTSIHVSLSFFFNSGIRLFATPPLQGYSPPRDLRSSPLSLRHTIRHLI